jgi:HEAT repeat protein
LVEDDDPTVRLIVVSGLNRSTDGVPALVNALRDKDPKVRQEAIRAVGQLGTAARAAIPAVIELLNADDGYERVLAAEALAYLEARSPAAISALVKIMAERDLGLGGQAIAALGRIGPSAEAAVPALTEAVRSTDPAFRIEAALALAQVKPDPQAILPVLVEVFQDRNHPFRVRALEALSRLGLSSPDVLMMPVRMLWDDMQARAKAAEILGRMGPAAKAAAPDLADVLRGSDNPARVQAALALWRIDRRNEEVIPVLVGALKSTFTATSRASLLIPGRFGTPGTPPGPLCQQAADALGEMGPEALSAVPALTEVLKDPQLAPYHPYYALALLKIDRQTYKLAVPILVEALEGKGPTARLSEQAAATFRKQAASALGPSAMEAQDALMALARALEDVDAGVRQEAANALGEVGAPARQALPALRKALTDPDEGVRSEASRALKKIGG